MYIEAVPNRGSPPAILLRESYREAGKVKKRTLLNLSDWPHERIAGFKALLKGGTVIPKDQDAITIIRSHFECRNEYRHYGGDHIIFIGHVERYAYTGKPTLLFCRGKYMRGEPLLPP